MLRLEQIAKSFGNQNEMNYQPVLNEIDLNAGKSESIAIVGPSGAGKTTLLNIAGTLDFPDSGRVFFNEKDLSELKSRELDLFRNEEIGFVFQFHHLLPQCTLLENVLLPTMINRDSQKKKESRQYAEELLRRVGIWDHRDKVPGKLSGGECQRAAVVRAMINHPSLLLADEPTGALDNVNAENIMDLLVDLNKEEGVGLLVVTHSISLAEKMDKVFELKNGSLNLQKG